ncbi:UNVERIFIED_CONTAM: hypothetical protein FKN15_027334 [Acipenser sinensis]
MVECFKFRRRAQFNGESVRQYIVNLQEFSTTCKLGDLVDQIIQDQFIEKTNNSKTKERFLIEPDALTLDRTTAFIV